VPSATHLPPHLRARYGLGRPPVALLVGVGLVVALLASFLAWTGWVLSNPATTSELLAFRVVSATRVDVTFEVRRSGENPTTCVVRAQDEKHDDVGYATLTITPGRDYVQVTYPLATRSTAVEGELLGCDEGQAPRVDQPDFPPGTVNPAQQPTVDGS